MNKNWKEEEGKVFKFILTTGKIYTGKITSVEQRGDIYSISLKTIFNENVGFYSILILSYVEVKK